MENGELKNLVQRRNKVLIKIADAEKELVVLRDELGNLLNVIDATRQGVI